MRWAQVFLESLTTGVFSIFVSRVILVIAARLWTRYVLGIGPTVAVGWDPISLFGSHWKLAVMGIPAAFIAFGFSAGFWFSAGAYMTRRAGAGHP